jgi:hypothetical protein
MRANLTFDCLWCGAVMKRQVLNLPIPGDITFCWKCEHFMTFGKDCTLRKLDESKVTDPKTIREMECVRSFFDGLRLKRAVVSLLKRTHQNCD